jgi:ribonuclease HI
MTNLVAFIDGSCFGNPGESGCGIVLRTEDGILLEQAGKYLGHSTNNIAEYQGLLHCLDLALKHRADSLTVYSDSQLLVNQINGSYRVKKPHLVELHVKVEDFIDRNKIRLTMHHIPREKNRDADRLARNAIRSHSDTNC